jgi:hypothetical protein
MFFSCPCRNVRWLVHVMCFTIRTQYVPSLTPPCGRLGAVRKPDKRTSAFAQAPQEGAHGRPAGSHGVTPPHPLPLRPLHLPAPPAPRGPPRCSAAPTFQSQCGEVGSGPEKDREGGTQGTGFAPPTPQGPMPAVLTHGAKRGWENTTSGGGQKILHFLIYAHMRISQDDVGLRVPRWQR